MSISNQPAPTLDAGVQIGPEFMDIFIAGLRPLLKETLESCIPKLSPRVTSLVNYVAIQSSDRTEARRVKGELLNAKRAYDEQLLIDGKTLAHLLKVSPRAM